MPAASDPIALLSRALDQAGTAISGVRPEQAALPTPCRSWDVRALVNHIVDDVQRFTASARGGSWQERDDDLIDDDWSAAYRESAASLLAVWQRPGALDATVRLPFGEVPASWQVYQVISTWRCTPGTSPGPLASRPTSPLRSGSWQITEMIPPRRGRACRRAGRAPQG